MSVTDFLIILLAGVGAGTINTVVGSGSLITFPTLVALGYPPLLANVSNNIGLVPGSISGVLRLPARAGGPADALAAAGARVDRSARSSGPSCCWCCRAGCSTRSSSSSSASRWCWWWCSRRCRGGWPLGGPHGAPTAIATSTPVRRFWCALAGVYGGYFGAAQGIILISCSDLHRRRPAAPQRLQERAGRLGQRGRRDRVHPHHRRRLEGGRHHRRRLHHRRADRRPVRPAAESHGSARPSSWSSASPRSSACSEAVTGLRYSSSSRPSTWWIGPPQTAGSLPTSLDSAEEGGR